MKKSLKQCRSIARLTATRDKYAHKMAATNRSSLITESPTVANIPGFISEEKKGNLFKKLTAPCTTLHRPMHRHRPKHHKFQKLWPLSHTVTKMKQWYLPRLKDQLKTNQYQRLKAEENQTESIKTTKQRNKLSKMIYL